MEKVNAILPKEVRFADFRSSREGLVIWQRHPLSKTRRKNVSKLLAAEYKALRKDARFAGPRMAAALHKMVSTNTDAALCSRLLYRPLDRHVQAMYWDERWTPLANLGTYERTSTSAHPSINDPSKIACYPTRADAARRREVVMGAGKFFYAILDPSPPHVIQACTEDYLAAQTPLTVFFVDNDDPNIDEDDLSDAWANTYASARGFSSCMVGFETTWRHPARFYAYHGNGLSLAYMTHNNLPDGEVVARAICNKKAKAYVRCYGDARLARALESQFGLILDPDEALDGVKCRAREHNNRLLAPYVDGGLSIRWDGSTSFCTLTTGNGDYEAQNTDGYADGGNSAICDECDESCYDEDLTYSEYHERHLCPVCRERSYTYAYTSKHNQDWVEDELVIHVGSDAYLDKAEVLNAHGYVFSDYHETYISDDEAVYLEYMGDYVDIDDVVKLDVEYEGDTYALSNDTKQIVLNGETLTVHIDYVGPEDDEEGDEDEVSAPETIAALAA